MPPEDAPRHPATHERRAVLDWIRGGARRPCSEKRRRSRSGIGAAAEQRRVRLHDPRLDGVDIRPTREFPVDPANESGFDNSGDSLTMSPALLKKYLAAARLVADHLVLTPDGFRFAPHPVDHRFRSRQILRRAHPRILRTHKVDYADYFLAAWRFEHRVALGKPGTRLSDIAREAGLSVKYLDAIHTTLTESWPVSSPLGELQSLWRRCPPTPRENRKRGDNSETMRDFVIRTAQELQAARARLARQRNLAGQPALGAREKPAARGACTCVIRETSPRAISKSFAACFPTRSSSRIAVRTSTPSAAGTGRPLTAGFHLMQGYFRDDGPLSELVLDQAEAARARRTLVGAEFHHRRSDPAVQGLHLF